VGEIVKFWREKKLKKIEKKNIFWEFDALKCIISYGSFDMFPTNCPMNFYFVLKLFPKFTLGSQQQHILSHMFCPKSSYLFIYLFIFL
jgi:hypothetical protein